MDRYDFPGIKIQCVCQKTHHITENSWSYPVLLYVDPIKQIMDKIEELCGTKISKRLVLSFYGKHLEPTKSLMDYNVQRGSTLYVIFYEPQKILHNFHRKDKICPCLFCQPECTICIEEFDEFETKLKRCKNHHTFHSNCLDKWHETSNNCPLCKTTEMIK